MKPLISVIITNYNYSQYIKKAIQSIGEQTYPNIELLIYDDGSTDQSIEVIESILPSIELTEVKFIKQENQGIVKTRNRALEELSGEYYIFLDADDYFNFDFVEEMYKVSIKSGADIVYPNWHVFELETGKNYTTHFDDFSLDALQKQMIHITPESLVKTTAVTNVRFESEFVAEDWQFFLQLAFLGKTFKLAKKCFINYQIKGNSRASHNSYTADTLAFEEILTQFRNKFDELVIEPGYIIQKRMSELELDRAAVLDKLSVAEDNLLLLSQSNACLAKALSESREKAQRYKSLIVLKDTHIQNLENSKLGKLQNFFRTRLKK